MIRISDSNSHPPRPAPPEDDGGAKETEGAPGEHEQPRGHYGDKSRVGNYATH